MAPDIFSEREGYSSIEEKEITIREDAPMELRGIIIENFCNSRGAIKKLREIVCDNLQEVPDINNWSPEYIKEEILCLLEHCHWFLVYNIIENIIVRDSCNREEFETRMNKYFILHGIGWKIDDGLVKRRGHSEFEQSIRHAEIILDKAGLLTSKKEIKEAIMDLSRRPTPDITGVIQHAGACLECVTREATNDTHSTLGALLKRYPNIFPFPLKDDVKKVWGYASNNGRHLKEGGLPTYEQVEFVLGVVAKASTYLCETSEKIRK